MRKKQDAPRLLRGWKSIAAYLAQSSSAAQRWAKEGMPVRREGRSVVADPAELNGWLGRESHAHDALSIASPEEDLLADLRRGLRALRKRRAA